MSRPWFRMYHEFVSDPKVQLLAFEDQRHFVALLCLKCNETLDSKAIPDLRERMIAKALGLDPSAAAEVKRRLVEAGLITVTWHPKQWDARQFESDTSSARTAAYRQRKKNDRRSDGAVTSQERTRSDTDTDTDTDTEQKKRAAAPLVLHESLPKDAWDEWIAHRKQKRWPQDRTTLQKHLNILAPFDTERQRLILSNSIQADWRGLFPLKESGKPKSNGVKFKTWQELEAEALARGETV